MLTEPPGHLGELVGDVDEAIASYENALRANSRSIPAMNAISAIYRKQEQYPKALSYIQNILKLDETNGEVWGHLGTSHGLLISCVANIPLYRSRLFDDQ